MNFSGYSYNSAVCEPNQQEAIGKSEVRQMKENIKSLLI
jgi:hypothetical protein